jgi:putative addiction module killer protein
LLQVLLYEDEFYRIPFAEWIAFQADKTVKARIAARIGRLEQGNLGDHKYLQDGVWELRLNFGGGIRIYFAREDDCVILLLSGGNKSTQKKDIQRAIAFYQAYRRNNK